MRIVSHFHPHQLVDEPDAVEYVFESDDTERSLPREVTAGYRTADTATAELHQRLASVKYPTAQAVARLLKDARIVSIVREVGGEVYYRAQLAPPFSQARILVQFCGQFPDIVGNVDLRTSLEYREFLSVFRNVTRDIPPYNNIWSGDGQSLTYFDVVKSGEGIEGHAERMGEWLHGIPLLFNGCGDYYLLSPNGRIGFRDHGAVRNMTIGQQKSLAKLVSQFSGQIEPAQFTPRPPRPLMTEVNHEEFIAAVLKQLPSASTT